MLGLLKDTNHNHHNMTCFALNSPKNLKLEAHKEVLFVYRDPVERFIAVFINKFIDERGFKGIRTNFEQLTQKPFEQASFGDFVHYAQADFHKLDCHLHPQKITFMGYPVYQAH